MEIEKITSIAKKLNIEPSFIKLVFIQEHLLSKIYTKKECVTMHINLKGNVKKELSRMKKVLKVSDGAIISALIRQELITTWQK